MEADSSTYFPTSKAGLIAWLEIIALALIVTAAQTAYPWFAGGTAATLVLVALVATVPHGIKAKGTGLRAPITQRWSGWIYLGALVLGLVFITASMMTRQVWWSLVAGVVCVAGGAVALVVIAIRQRTA
ncbi:hypothetical protein ASE14_01050 [Agromyces sp. Root81]|uniref:hypothetical protein n=1 Tax=Agromyces sp. Root81 TaxID=1736601 RepID=UPI0007022E4F|nr:hypothetical protein [Agromyces sp. Root81]KRC62456.1 hypothetical protein ASE14_01050 [Agromyces sp. Root81]